jgi:uncharacterized ion transporter superfamily protein YfcC
VFHDTEYSNKKFYFVFFLHIMRFLVHSAFFGFFETFLPFTCILIKIGYIL